jgi:hypothetical protein
VNSYLTHVIKKKIPIKIHSFGDEKEEEETSKLLNLRFSKIKFLFQIMYTNKFLSIINQIIFEIVAT